MKLNTTEQNVLTTIIDACYYDFFADAKYIANICDLTVAQAKGYMGDLIKKNLVVTGEVDACDGKLTGVHSVDPDGVMVSFGCDEYSEEDMLTFYKNKGVL
jgi:hypothetical protein